MTGNLYIPSSGGGNEREVPTLCSPFQTMEVCSKQIAGGDLSAQAPGVGEYMGI